MPDANTMTRCQQNHRFCGTGKKGFWSACSSLLVPLMIAVFTITTTMLQMNATKQINEQNLKIATDNRDIANYTRLQQLAIEDARLKQERDNQDKKWEVDKQIALDNRKQDLQIAEDNRKQDERIEQDRHERNIEINNETRLHQIFIEEARLKQEREIEDERRAADFRVAEARQMDVIVAAYIKEMGEYLLIENFTLENHRLATVLRAKTLTALRQLNGQRKAYLIQFLYEAELLAHKKNSLDLSGAELSNIDLSGRKLDNISLSGALLRQANLSQTSICHSNLNSAELSGASFFASQASGSSFIGAKLVNTDLKKGTFIRSTFDKCDGSESNFTEAVLTSATFVQARLVNTSWRLIQGHSIRFDQANLENADLYGASLVESNFQSASVNSTNFRNSILSSTNWRNASVLGADFRSARLKAANITNEQLRQTFSFEKAVFSNRSEYAGVNLLANGDAEKRTTNSKCSINNWQSDEKMVARPYSSADKVPIVLGACFFTGLENEITATMYQRVKIRSATETGSRTNSHLWIHGRCRRLIPDDENFPQIRLRQFNRQNYNLQNYSWTLGHNDEYFIQKKVSCNSATTEVEFEISFRREKLASRVDTFGYCDNLRLSFYDDD